MCLEDDWKKPFKFASDSVEEIQKLYLNETDQYECDDPIIKLVKDRIETETEQYQLKKFRYDKETVVKVEVYLSGMQKASKRQTP